jgi:hypothetical protein
MGPPGSPPSGNGGSSSGSGNNGNNGGQVTPPTLRVSGVTLPILQARQGAPVLRSATRVPVILYSPGYEDDRELGSGLVSDLASRGYLVVTIGHTYEASEIEFPNGRVEVSKQGTGPAVMATAITTRIADARFVLDQVEALNRGKNPDAEHRHPPSNLAGALNVTKVGMFGHSLGGATAAETMAADRRFQAGIDLDGSVVTSVTPTSRDQAERLAGAVATRIDDRPFMVMTSHGLGPNGGEATLGGFWSKLTGWRRFLSLASSQHYSYTDEEEFLSQLVAAGKITAANATEYVVPAIGTIDPARAVSAERTYIASFFDLHLRGRNDHLLDKPSSQYPEVQFLGS